MNRPCQVGCGGKSRGGGSGRRRKGSRKKFDGELFRCAVSSLARGEGTRGRDRDGLIAQCVSRGERITEHTEETCSRFKVRYRNRERRFCSLVHTISAWLIGSRQECGQKDAGGEEVCFLANALARQRTNCAAAASEL